MLCVSNGTKEAYLCNSCVKKNFYLTLDIQLLAEFIFTFFLKNHCKHYKSIDRIIKAYFGSFRDLVC